MLHRPQVLSEAVQFFRADFQTAQQRSGMLANEVARFLPPAGQGGGGGGGGGPGGGGGGGGGG